MLALDVGMVCSVESMGFFSFSQWSFQSQCTAAYRLALIYSNYIKCVMLLLIFADRLHVFNTHIQNCPLSCDKSGTGFLYVLTALANNFFLSPPSLQSILLIGAMAVLCLGLDLIFLLIYSFWLCCRRCKKEDSSHSHSRSQQPSADCCCTAWCVIIATLVCR